MWYKIPGYTSIECDENGQIRSSKTHKLRKLTRKTGPPGQVGRTYLNIRDTGKPHVKRYVARLVLSAKLGRELEPWEEACHGNGDHSDNSMSNLNVGCRLNNIIDDIELGRVKTSPQELERAIERLLKLRDTID